MTRVRESREFAERSEEERKIEEEKERVRQEEDRRFSELAQAADEWRKASVIHGYLDWLEQREISAGAMDESIKSWIDWGRTAVEQRFSFGIPGCPEAKREV